MVKKILGVEVEVQEVEENNSWTSWFFYISNHEADQFNQFNQFTIWFPWQAGFFLSLTTMPLEAFWLQSISLKAYIYTSTCHVSDFLELHLILRIPWWGGLEKFPTLPANDRQNYSWGLLIHKLLGQMVSRTLLGSRVESLESNAHTHIPGLGKW